jgi:hypothetical protein
MTPLQQAEEASDELKPHPFETYKAYLTRLAPMSGLKKKVWKQAIAAMLKDAARLGVSPKDNAWVAVEKINAKAEELNQLVNERLGEMEAKLH